MAVYVSVSAGRVDIMMGDNTLQVDFCFFNMITFFNMNFFQLRFLYIRSAVGHL